MAGVGKNNQHSGVASIQVQHLCEATSHHCVIHALPDIFSDP